jgi:hypothetical protein
MPFSPSVRRWRCSQVGRAVLRQNAPVRRYASRVIRTACAQKSAPFPGRVPDVRARLHVEILLDLVFLDSLLYVGRKSLLDLPLKLPEKLPDGCLLILGSCFRSELQGFT